MRKGTKLIVIHVSLALLFCWADAGIASSLPKQFRPLGQFSFHDHPAANIGRGIPSLEVGPDHKLWMFQPPIPRKKKNRENLHVGRPGKIQTLDAGNGVLVDKTNQLSNEFGMSENGAVFTHDGKLLSFRTGFATATLRDSVDGLWFDDNDRISKIRWPFGILSTVGHSEPSPAAFGPDGTLYITVPRKNRIIVFKPEDVTDLGNPQHTYLATELPPDKFGRRPMGIAFDPHGNMFITTRDLFMGKDDDGNDIYHDVLIGIDPVDGIFFNKSEKVKVYDLNVILSSSRQPLDNVLITDMAFDPHGFVILFDAKTETLHRLRPIMGLFDQFSDGMPSLINYPIQAMPYEGSEMQ